ncbi:Mov34/MPN/PAD-1 family protein [Micromonospora sp. NPDC048835]|uniref:Mov34/MPN/PAD-1 family protein n=1 Tax=Micromonospora sp. NPDC048835 TaxID=3155147 RepID=UPI0033CD53CA
MNDIAQIERVVLAPAAAATIRAEALRSADGNETGGLLLGHPDASATVWVRSAGDPGPAAVRRPSFFLRDLHHAQRLAAEASARDGSVWIGEWHTHPGALPLPSVRDLHTYLGFLADPELKFGAFLALILVAPNGTWHQPTAHAWACYHHAVELVPLTIMSNSITA